MPSASFDRIDYSVRPAKYAERRMLRDVFHRLSYFGPLEDYHYVGFGSVWFSDFILFHRSLGLKRMTSIESKEKAFDRVRDNAPYRIDLAFERASKAIPKLDWGARSFVWLDYDTQITKDCLRDIAAIVGKARSGSVIAISLRCDAADQLSDEVGVDSLKAFIEAFDRERVPNATTVDDLMGWPFSELSRNIVLNEIETALTARNGTIADKFSFHPVCSFNYADGVMMTTLVGVMVADTEHDKFLSCNFNSLDFVEVLGGTIRINVPKLTAREFKLLEAQLPLKEAEALVLGTIPAKEAASFEHMYRYLPNFVVAES